jgi:hypothetical protein
VRRVFLAAMIRTPDKGCLVNGARFIRLYT